MAEEFKAGDVVMLKSGGPKMTVSEVGDNYDVPTVWCTWFVSDKGPFKQDNGTFPFTSVKLIERS